jgi:hypothetical protein
MSEYNMFEIAADHTDIAFNEAVYNCYGSSVKDAFITSIITDLMQERFEA